MPEPATEPLLSFLDELFTTEQAIAQQLARQAAMSSTSARRELLQQLLRESRRHLGQMERSLMTHRQPRGLVRVGYDMGMGIGTQVFTAMLQLPRMLLRRSTPEPQRQLQAARELAVLMARQVAAATALEELASAAGDASLQELAGAVRTNDAAAHEQLLHEITMLADDVMTQALGGAPRPSAGRATRARSRPS